MLVPLARMDTLHCDSVGGILLVTQQFAKDGTVTSPYITLVTAPALATLGSVSATDPLGFAYSDFWDESVLSLYAFAVDDNDHCPLLVASEGFSRQVKLPSTIEFLTDSQPLFFPFGEELWTPVRTTTGTTTQAFFLPEVCNPPLGLSWPTTISYDDMYASVLALKGGYAHFLLVLTTLQPLLSTWLHEVNGNPTNFATACVSHGDPRRGISWRGLYDYPI
jgi:hypothetical protein